LNNLLDLTLPSPLPEISVMASSTDEHVLSLLDLPPDVIEEIALRLPLVDVCRLARSCSHLHEVLENDHVWTKQLERFFPCTNVDLNPKAQLMDLFAMRFDEERKHPEILIVDGKEAIASAGDSESYSYRFVQVE
jgi:hypothetical protein